MAEGIRLAGAKPDRARILITAGWDVAPPNDPDLRIWKGGDKISRPELLSLLPGIEGIVCGDERYDAELMDHMPNVRILSRAGNGWDNIDREAAAERDIRVVRQAGAYAGPVADSLIGMMLTFGRRILSLNASMHQGKWERERYPGIAMSEATVGIIGFGNIGRQVYWRLQGFEARVLVHRPSQPEDDFGVELDYLLMNSDFVVPCLALTPDTRHFIGPRELGLMKPTAYLLNASRGEVIDQQVLVEYLRDGQIAGAGLDVFEEEPLDDQHPLRSMENVILTPHNAYWSPNERGRVVKAAIDEAKAYLMEVRDDFK